MYHIVYISILTCCECWR